MFQVCASPRGTMRSWTLRRVYKAAGADRGALGVGPYRRLLFD